MGFVITEGKVRSPNATRLVLEEQKIHKSCIVTFVSNKDQIQFKDALLFSIAYILVSNSTVYSIVRPGMGVSWAIRNR
jgi:hypothetical protein